MEEVLWRVGEGSKIEFSVLSVWALEFGFGMRGIEMGLECRGGRVVVFVEGEVVVAGEDGRSSSAMALGFAIWI